MQMIRSKIQQINESIRIKNQMKTSMFEGLNALVNKYNVVDSVFGLGVNGIYEHTRGYFEVISEHDSLEDVMNVWESGKSIRVMGSSKFQLGQIHEFISECIAASYKKSPGKTVTETISIINEV